MENCARRIIKSRARAIELIRPAFAAAFAAFAPEGEAPDIIYCPNAPHEELQALWKSLREGKDAALGHTSRGPHRDNYAITLNGNLAELYASEGQKFSLVLALKLSGLNFLHEKLGIAPILVADDLLLELDAMRQERFWKSLGNLQVFASGTTPPRPSDDKPWNIWNAKQGTFAR